MAHDEVKLNERRTALVCCGSGCPGADEVARRLADEVKRLGLDIEVKPTGCHGFCQVGPTVILQPEGVFYCRVSADDVTEIVGKLRDNQAVERLLYVDPATE